MKNSLQAETFVICFYDLNGIITNDHNIGENTTAFERGRTVQSLSYVLLNLKVENINQFDNMIAVCQFC